MVGLMDVEKMERFYLTSCTDLPSEARSMHQSFPGSLRLSDSEGEENVRSSKRSRSNSNHHHHQFRRRSRSRSRSRGTMAVRSSGDQSNNKVKQAFMRVYGTLMTYRGKTLNTREEGNIPTSATILSQGSRMMGCCSSGNVTPTITMSKEEFIEKFHTLVSEIKEKSELTSPATDNATDSREKSGQQENGVKERKGILSNGKAATNSSERNGLHRTAAGKVIIIGLCIAVLIGIVKAADGSSSSNHLSPVSAKSESFR